MSDKYVLVGQTPVPVDDLLKWAVQFEVMDRRVAFTRVFDLVDVSTVFLGLDHSFHGGRPLLFESMAFWADEHGAEMARCSTWLEAELQHAEMVREVSSWRPLCAYVWRRWVAHWTAAAEDWRVLWPSL